MSARISQPYKKSVVTIRLFQSNKSTEIFQETKYISSMAGFSDFKGVLKGMVELYIFLNFIVVNRFHDISTHSMTEVEKLATIAFNTLMKREEYYG